MPRRLALALALALAGVARAEDPQPPSSLARTGIDAFSLYDIGAVRGLDASRVVGSFRWNGLPLLNMARSASESSDRYDVQTGLRALETGFVYPGGVIDLASKDARAPALSFAAGAWSSATVYGAADAGNGWLRMNLARDTGAPALRQLHRARGMVAAGAALEPAPGTRLAFSFEQADWSERGEQAGVAVDGQAIPRAPSGRTLLGQSWGTARGTERTLSARLTHDLTSDWSLVAGVVRLDDRMEDTDFFGRLLPGGRYELSYARDPRQGHRTDTAQLGLRGTLQAAGLAHRIALTFAAMDFRATTHGYASAVLGASPVNAPAGFDPISLAGAPSAFVGERAHDAGWTLSDSVALGGGFTALAALRAGRYRQTGANVIKPADERYRLASAGLVHAPVGGGPVLYASYGEALEQGGAVPLGATNALRVLPSRPVRQLEAGARFAPWPGMEFEAAAFRAHKAYSYPDAAGLFVQDGRLEHQGVEMKAVGTPAKGWRLYGAALLLHARVRDTADPAAEGRRAIDVPARRLKLVVERSVGAVQGLSVHAALDAYSSRAADAYGMSSIPGYGVASAGIQLERRWLGERTRLRIEIDNIADRAYWAAVPGGYLMLGAPRTLQFRLEVVHP